MLSVIVPACNEARWIGPCLDAVAASTGPERAEVIVVANGCTDDTAAVAGARSGVFAQRGWRLRVLDLPQGGKLAALNAGDAAAQGQTRAYLDADVRASPDLLRQIDAALAREAPAYASGRPVVARAQSAVTRAYARFWTRLPFIAAGGVPGFGLFAVNGAGRARWDAFPDIISDDTFVRLHFAPDERIAVPATYEWPMVEGFGRLIRVRRRQDRGVAEVLSRWPHLAANADNAPPGPGGLARLALRDPVGFAVYAAVALAVRGARGDDGHAWARGR